MTHAVPVFEGFSMPNAIRRVDIAGRQASSPPRTHSLRGLRLTPQFFPNTRDVTDHLQLLLRKAGYNLHTSAEKEVVRIIKEKNCYVALNPAKEDKEAAASGRRGEEFRLPDGNVVRV